MGREVQAKISVCSIMQQSGCCLKCRQNLLLEDRLRLVNYIQEISSIAVFIYEQWMFFPYRTFFSFFHLLICLHAFIQFLKHTILTFKHIEEIGFVKLYRYKNLFMQFPEHLICTYLFDRMCFINQRNIFVKNLKSTFFFLHWIPSLQKILGSELEKLLMKLLTGAMPQLNAERRLLRISL